RRDERVAAVQLRALDAGERDGDALARVGASDRRVVYLHAAYTYLAAARLDTQHVRFTDRAGPERARGDGADAAEREHPVDVEARRRNGARAFLRRRRERGAQLVETGAGTRADRDDRRARDELLRLRARKLERLVVD